MTVLFKTKPKFTFIVVVKVVNLNALKDYLKIQSGFILFIDWIFLNLINY